ncbi:MAG: glutaminyl-peptide cyclotransferase [Acidobacteria bacterium]|nr:glutaminyl-peptide cyclotransferase [Acidobacteriota bacterium]MCB9397356.1 glutaminyl-peptide cyclotransferase [Acidobacteriota bacterium]
MAGGGLLVLGFFAVQNFTASPVQRLTFEVVQKWPHDTDAFTQGLQVWGDFFLEGTGGLGKSQLRLVQPESGAVYRSKALAPDEFGEGVCLVGDEIYQITWKNQIAYVYDAQTFERKRSYSFSGEGWGLTYTGKHLVMSDGSDTLYFRDPQSFEVVRTVKVRQGSRAIRQLNELEYVDGFVWANVWQTSEIVKINPSNGAVVAVLDCRGLLNYSDRTGHEDVLNGIAHRAHTDTLFLTGKNWPYIFEIKVRQSGDPKP